MKNKQIELKARVIINKDGHNRRDIKEIMLDILKRDGLINNDEYCRALREVRRHLE